LKGRDIMNFVRPGILVVCIAGLALSAFLLFGNRWGEGPAPDVPEPAGRAAGVQESLAAAPNLAPSDQPAPSQGTSAAKGEPAEEAAKKAAEAAEAQRKAEVMIKARAQYAEKLRREKVEKRRIALDRLNELKYPDSEAERIRDTWDSAIADAEAELAALRLARANVGARETRLAYRGAYNGLREELGEAEYGAARYADQLSTWVGVRPGLEGNRAGQIGLLPMDQIYSYDGFRLFEVEEFGKRRAQEPSDGVATLGIVRDNKLFYLDVDIRHLGFPVTGMSVPPESP
jgi:hypothetical protein